MKKKLQWIVVAFILMMVLASCGQEEQPENLAVDVADEDSAQETDTQESEQDVPEESDPEPGVQEEVEDEEEPVYQDYVDLELVDKDGNPVKLSDYEGKFIALNFFGTWCTYCMQEMPDLEKVYSEYEGDDFVIILMNATTTEKISAEEVGQWYEDGGYTMPMMMDLDGTALSTYPVQGFPTTYFINQEGKVLGAISGMLDEATLLSIIETYK